MKNRFKKYAIFVKSGFQTAIAYRGAIFLWFIGGIINAAVLCLLWWAVFNASPDNAIPGFTLPQMMLYMMLSAIVGEISFTSTMGEISDDIHDGVIGMRLMKPINYRAQLGFSTVGGFLARFTILAVPMIALATVISVFGFGLTGLKWYNIVLFVPAVFLAVMFSDTLGFLFGQLAFRTQAMFGVQSIMTVLVGFLSGAMVPIALFPDWAQTVLYYTPFPSMMSMPIRLFLGQMTPIETLTAFGISALWLLVLNLLGAALYKSSVRHVVVFGG